MFNYRFFDIYDYLYIALAFLFALTGIIVTVQAFNHYEAKHDMQQIIYQVESLNFNDIKNDNNYNLGLDRKYMVAVDESKQYNGDKIIYIKEKDNKDFEPIILLVKNINNNSVVIKLTNSNREFTENDYTINHKNSYACTPYVYK